MRKILFVTTQYRVGERIYPIIPRLSLEYDLDLMTLYQMKPDWEWPGDNDLRESFNKKYLKYFNNIYDNIDIDYSEYELILTDDNRTYNGLSEIYDKSKCLVLACSHGNHDIRYDIQNVNISFDGCFVFGQKDVETDYQIPGGIPSNDALKNYNVEKEYILVIVNYLGHYGDISTGTGKYFKLMDKELFDNIDFLRLQKKYDKLIVFKLKIRPDTDIQKEINYLTENLPDELDFKVLLDVGDDNMMIAKSSLVISSASTLALKAIQLKIPTLIIKDIGIDGVFKDYSGMVESNKQDIKKFIEFGVDVDDFIARTVQGGLEFNSTKYFTDYIRRCVYE